MVDFKLELPKGYEIIRNQSYLEHFEKSPPFLILNL